MNTINKEADFVENFVQVRLTADLEGDMRATLDANASADVKYGKLGVRFAGAKVNSEDYRAHSRGKVDYQMINMVWLPSRNTKISLTGEKGYREKPNGLGYFTTAGVGDGTEIPLQITHPDIPWEWNWAVGNMRSAETSYFRGAISHSFTDDLSVNAYYQYLGRHQVDSNGWNAAGQGASAAAWDMGWSSRGGNVTGWLNPNTPDEKIAMHRHYRHWANSNWAAGATAVYRLNIGDIGNTFTTGAHTWYERFNTRKATQPGDSPNILYFPVQANIDLRLPAGPPSDYFWDRPERENSANTYYFFSWQMSALDNRLRTSAGINQTRLNLKTLRTAGDDPHYYWTKTNETKMDKWSPMVGAMYDVTKEVSLFAVYSTSLFPTTDKDTLMNPLPPIEGKSYEFGTKVELMEGKISGTISYFNITQTGGAQTDPAADNVDTLRWDSMTPEQRALQFPNQDRDDLLGDLVPGSEQESKGIEVDLVFNPLASWQIVLSYAHINQETVDAVNTALIGQSTTGLVKDQMSFLTKYSFTEGSAEGLSLGLGGQMSGKALQGYHSSTGQARYNPSTFYLEAFATYRFQLMGLDALVQLNAKNITQQDDFVGWKETGNANVWATKRYMVPTEARYSLTFGVDF
ncbi:MAG: Ferripyoverdine receptor precursor [Verrucomicrobia bacterium ADurb.Bin474]|nr:MAG: Ferripyoverdine receptor precursor [Verrucomicrobia bacterium ADurb.Bin474]